MIKDYHEALKGAYHNELPQFITIWGDFFNRFSPLEVAYALHQVIGLAMEKTNFPLAWNGPTMLMFYTRFYAIHTYLEHSDSLSWDTDGSLLPTTYEIGPGTISEVLQTIEDDDWAIGGRYVLLLVELKNTMEKVQIECK